MPQLVVLTGPIAAGKNTTAEVLVRRAADRGLRVVVVDLDDVAAMVGPPGAAAAGLWFAAHEAHGALVGQWTRAEVDLVVAVGPIYTVEEQAALIGPCAETVRPLWVVLDAPAGVTFARAQADEGRGRSREPDFHASAHARFRALLPHIPRDLYLDTSVASPHDCARAVEAALQQ